MKNPREEAFPWRSRPEGGRGERRLETRLKCPSAPSWLALRALLAVTSVLGPYGSRRRFAVKGKVRRKPCSSKEAQRSDLLSSGKAAQIQSTSIEETEALV